LSPENFLYFVKKGVVDGFTLVEVLLNDARVDLLKQEVSLEASIISDLTRFLPDLIDIGVRMLYPGQQN
jgi:hypothetical protein